jgi:hypothetical protein
MAVRISNHLFSFLNIFFRHLQAIGRLEIGTTTPISFDDFIAVEAMRTRPSSRK